nr:reverse transcriptase domain-containing protein [Tanacetum cinerariifolium]
MPLSVWKKLGLPELISTRMTLELANRAICTPDGIARDVFISVGKFTFPADFFIVDYESDPRVSLILGRPFLRTDRALIDVHGEEMILRDGDERLKNMLASFFQMNTASTSRSRPLPSNTIANPKGELKVITTRCGLVLDGPSVPMPPLFINLEEDKRVKETLMDLDLAEYAIKVPPPLVQKAKPPSQRNYVVHQRYPLYPISLILQGCTRKNSKTKMKSKFISFGKCSKNFTSISLLLML